MAWYNPTDPTQRNWMLGGLAALVLIIPYNMYLLAPRNEANATTQADVERLETLNRRASVLSAQGGGDLEARLALYERHVARLETLIPAVDALGPEPPEPAGPYDRRAYNMAVIGEYHSVGRFLTAIANLSRIVTSVQVDLEIYQQAQQYPDLDSPVRASFRIETYVFSNRPAEPAGAQVGG
jgi:Tfp pilus assembly protein PilO